MIAYNRGGKIAARGPNVAGHSVFSGPRKPSGKLSNLKYSPTYTVHVNAESNSTETCFSFHKKVWPSAKRGLLKQGPGAKLIAHPT